MQGPNPNFTIDHPLAQAALAKLRSICKGNGVKTDAVTLVSHTISEQSLNAGTYLELRPVTSENVTAGKTVTGQLVSSQQEADRIVDQTLSSAANNPAFKAQISDLLLRRPDQGFGLSNQAIPVDFLRRELCWHEPCNSCRGSGQGPCGVCGGRKVETCTKCGGRSMMLCPQCLGTGLIQGNKCGRCHGQRYVSCDMCHHSGMMSCRTCRGTGISRCGTCSGQGYKTHVRILAPQAITYFEYDRKAIPTAAADLIETSGAALAAQGAITVKGRIADDKENVLGASYEVYFPYGEITFMVGKKEVKGGVFGKNARLVSLPNILDKMLQGPVQDLEEAAQDVGSVAAKIQKATRYRLIAQAFLLASRTTTQKTIAMLMKQYDVGLSRGMAEKIAVLADETTSRITRKPRYYGLAAGLAAFGIATSAYYFLGIRSMAASLLPDMRFDFIFDLLPPVLGALTTTSFIQMFAAGSIRKALGHLIKDKKHAPVARARTAGLWGYAGVALITLVAIETSTRFGQSLPYWYGFIRALVTAP